MHSIVQMPADASSTQASNQTPASHPMLHAEILAALSSALGLGGTTRMMQMTSSGAPQPARKYFSQAITNAMSELLITVIKELKGGFKNYIPLALCTHKACANVTRATETLDMEVGFNEKGEMRLKQRYFSAVRDHYLTTDSFTEIRENFIWGMRKYLVLGDDSEPGGGMASDCADMFQEFFSVIAARPDFTLDWPSYRGYIIETYMSWVGRRDDSFGLIFDEGLFYKYKMSNLGPLIIEEMKHVGSMLNNRGSSSFAGGNSFAGGSGFAGGGGFMGSSGYTGARGRGRGVYSSGPYNPGWGGSHPPFFAPSFCLHQPSTATLKCYLCADPHFHKDHQGSARQLVLNEQGKWIDKALGDRIVCIAFNSGPNGCRQPTCNYSHSCSLCGDFSHGSGKCNA